jgi:hypothetical protein
MIAVRTLVLALAAAASLVALKAPRTDARPQTAPPTTSESALESAKARWERFTPEQKARAKERYERFLALSAGEREQLLESARRLHERTEAVQKELEDRGGERFKDLDPEKRRALVREMVAEESRTVGARIRGRLPDGVVARLEKARPEDRARYFRNFRIQQRDRVARYAIGSLGKELGLERAEIDRMQALPGPERCAAVLDLRKRLSEKDVRVSGLPPGLTQEEWDRWLELPPEDFFEAIQKYREDRIGDRARRDALRSLAEALRPRPEELLAMADLAPAERNAKLEAERRARCTQALREGTLLSREEFEALERTSDAEFFRGVRRLFWRTSRGPSLRPAPSDGTGR